MARLRPLKYGEIRRKFRVAALIVTAISFLPSIALAGYSHAFIWKIDPSDPRLAQCVAEMNQLVEARGDILKVTPPDPSLRGQDQIHINGIGDDEYEDFIFPGNNVSHNIMFGPNVPANLVGLNSCKTAYKPYDEVVTACLIVARDHFTEEELQIVSDGSWDDWQPGRDLYERVLHRPAHSPLQDKVAVFSPPQSGGSAPANLPMPLGGLPGIFISQKDILLGLGLVVPIAIVVTVAVRIFGRRSN